MKRGDRIKCGSTIGKIEILNSWPPGAGSLVQLVIATSCDGNGALKRGGKSV